MTYEEIIKEVSASTGLTQGFVDKVYKSYWRAIREYIKKMPLKEDMTEEGFNALKTNINVPSLGKFYITWDRYFAMRTKYKSIHNVKNQKDKA